MADLIGLLGVKGSGKTYTRNRLMSEIPNSTGLDFKDALFTMCADLMGFSIPTSEQEYDLFKLSVIGMHDSPDCVAESKALLARFPHLMTGRKLLQRLGTDVIRARMPNYWADIMAGKARRLLSMGTSVICADVRFMNEVRVLRELSDVAKVKFIFCDYRSGRYSATDAHESERLAQRLLEQGLKDGESITEAHFKQAEAA